MFDRYMGARRPSWKRRAILVGSLLLHGGLVVALVVGSWLRVAELTPPLLAVVFNPVGEPPPQSSSPPKAKRPPKRPPAARTQPTTVMQPQPSVAPEPPSDPGDDHGDDRDPPGPPGPPGGGGGNPSAPPCIGGNCVAAPAPKPKNVPPHALDAERLAGAMPHLPASVIEARRGLGESTFIARICVAQSGAVSSVTVLSGIPGADDTIVATLRTWRYRPQPIPVCFISQLLYDVER
jgi:protein TonB